MTAILAQLPMTATRTKPLARALVRLTADQRLATLACHNTADPTPTGELYAAG